MVSQSDGKRWREAGISGKRAALALGCKRQSGFRRLDNIERDISDLLAASPAEVGRWLLLLAADAMTNGSDGESDHD